MYVSEVTLLNRMSALIQYCETVVTEVPSRESLLEDVQPICGSFVSEAD